MTQPARIYIVASPQPRVGKTLIARLLLEFYRANRRPLVGYDLSPREPALAERFPELVWPLDITETRGQMQLFDRLIAESASTKIVDLGYSAYERFFAVMQEIGFAPEARRRGIEPIVLFVADPSPATMRSYAELRQRSAATLVPVHNESVSVMFAKEDFPATRAACPMLRIPRLSPLVRGVISRPNFSFNAYMAARASGPTEIHQWIGRVFAEFRDFELRLLLGKLGTARGAAPAPAAPMRKGGRAR